MVKLAQSLCYKEIWEQILEAIKNFNVGEQVRAMISSFDEEIETLRGDHGVQKQHYEIAKIAILTVSAIYAGWKLVGKLSRRFSRIEPEVPVSKLDQKNLDLQDTFADQINKSPEFSGLSKELQEQLTDDLAKIDDGGVFAEALTGNPRLVNSWKALHEEGIEFSRNDPFLLETVDEYLNPSISGVTRKFPDRMSLVEEALIRNYTKPGGFRDLNRALRGEIPNTPLYVEYKDRLNLSLDRLPERTGNGDIFRGVGVTEGNSWLNLSNGQSQRIKGFMSSSLDEDIAHVFRSKEDGNVILIIRNSRGKNIATISDAGFEGEILHNTDRLFEKVAQLPGQDPITGESTIEVIIRQLED